MKQVDRYFILSLVFIMISSTVIAQSYYNDPYRNNQRGRDRSIVPRSNTLPTQADYEKDFKERLEVHIKEFVTGLNADEFQKEIIKQKLMSYYNEKMAILKSEGISREDKLKSLERLDKNHFVDLKELTTPEVHEQIQEFVRTDPRENSEKKKKEKRKKKKDKG